MRLIRFLPMRWHGLTQEIAKFGVIGVANTLINFAVFNLLVLTVLGNGELKANVVATIAATTTSYFMNRHWTYRHRPKSTLRREYLLFFIFNLVGMAIELSVLGLAKYGFGIRALVVLNIFKAIGIVLGTIFRFWSYRTHVFKAGAPAAAEPGILDGAEVEPAGVAPQEVAPQPAPSGAASTGPRPGHRDTTVRRLQAELDSFAAGAGENVPSAS